MRLDNILYGPHNRASYEVYYYYDATEFTYGHQLNDANDSIGYGFQLQKTGIINQIGMYLIEIKGTPTYKMGIVTVSGDASGYADSYPSDTMYNNAQWQDFDPIVIGSGWGWINLDIPVSGYRGDFLAVVVTPSGIPTPDINNYVELNDDSAFNNASPGLWKYNTYWYHNYWQSPAGLKYSDDTIHGFCITSPIYESFATPEEWGLEFQIPIQATCVGWGFNFYSFQANSPFKAILADSSDIELASITIDDCDIVGDSQCFNAYVAWDTGTDPILSPNTTYRLYFKPTSSEIICKKGFIMESEESKSALPGGTNWKWIERPAPASGWITIANQYPYISLVLTDLTGEGGNGGGGQPTDEAAYGFVG